MSKVNQFMKSKSSGGGRRKYGKLSLRQRIEIIKASELGFSQRALASQYNCGKTQIHLLVTQKDMWLDKWERSKQGKNSHRSRPSSDQVDPFTAVNNLVSDFYSKLSTLGVSITGTMLQERAIQIAKELNHPDFNADNDWLMAFCANYDIELNESDDDAGLNLLKSFEGWAKDKALIQQYDLCNVYNLGEVRLPYKFVPSENSFVKPQSSKDYLTVSLCCNALGIKETEIVVYDRSQHGDVGSNVFSQCISNWKGIMTQSLYEKRLIQLNSEMARQNRHILLLVDESKYSGSLECSMSNVKVKPTSVILQSQPILCGIGHMFKFLYCRRLLRTLSAHLSAEDNVDDLAEKITITKAVRLIQNAWDDVQPRMIQNSFAEAGLDHFKNEADNISYSTESDEILLLEIKQLISLVRRQDIVEDLSDNYFSLLLNDEPCSNSASDCSDTETEDPCIESSSKVSMKSNEGIVSNKNSSCLGTQFNVKNLAAADLNCMIKDALPSISKLDYIASAFCNENQLQRARMLLSELEDLFEDVVTDHQTKNVSELTES